MGSSECNSTFNQMYDQTYKKTLHFVTARCGKPEDISDILQEIYAELYRTLMRKGISYIQNPEAFLMQLAKSKVYQHYSFGEKFKNLFSVSTLDEKREAGALDALPVLDYENDLEGLVADRILLKQIADFIRTKPHDVQKIFYLYYVLEQSSAQIALDLNLNESTVKSKVHRTIHEVRTLYGKVGKE